MSNDPFLDSRFLGVGSTQADVIYNEYLGHVAAGLGRVKSATVSVPPGSPATHDAYLIPPGATGDWAGKDYAIAVWVNAWRFITAKPGLRVLIEDSNTWAGCDADSVWRATAGDQTLTAVNNGGIFEITWDGALGNAAQLTLTDPTSVLLTPVNFRPGTIYALYVRQDGTGSRVLNFETAGWAFAGGTPPAVTSAPNAVDILTVAAPLGFAIKATIVSHVQNIS